MFWCVILAGFPVVVFTSGLEVTVVPERWSVRVGSGNIASRRQLPLKLAWAISIHKSQVWNTLSLNVHFIPKQGKELVSVPSFHTRVWEWALSDFSDSMQEPKDSEDCLISNTWYFSCHFLLVLLSLHVVGYDFGLCWNITGESIWRRTGICSLVKSPQSTVSESEEL